MIVFTVLEEIYFLTEEKGLRYAAATVEIRDPNKGDKIQEGIRRQQERRRVCGAEHTYKKTTNQNDVTLADVKEQSQPPCWTGVCITACVVFLSFFLFFSC